MASSKKASSAGNQQERLQRRIIKWSKIIFLVVVGYLIAEFISTLTVNQLALLFAWNESQKVIAGMVGVIIFLSPFLVLEEKIRKS